MPILFALSCAVVYGVADYCGGRASRTQPAVIVTITGQTVSLVLVAALVLVIGTPVAPHADWLWGGLGGFAGAVGLIAFYHALSTGAMTVVAPITAVVGAVLPVIVGVLQGDRPRPVAVVGMGVAVICVALVSGAGERRADRAHTSPEVIACAVLGGVGFGAIFVLLGQTSSDSGLWPLVAARMVSVPLLALVVVVRRTRVGSDRRMLRLAVAAGILDMVANGLYLAAVRGELLSLVAVISSLYPASTVTLAFLLDREHVSRRQAVGLGLAGVALTMVAMGRS